jgi:site-specific DNA recombinase
MNAKKTARHLALVPAAPPNTASINIRLSKKAREENLSKEGMLNDARALCLRHGLRIVAEHIDEQSGAIRDRKGFMAWLADGREGRAAVLVAFHVDRMTREGTNVAALILDVVEGKDEKTGAVVRHPVRLLDCKGLDSEGDDTAFRFRLVIEAEVARAERKRMADRSLDMHRRFRAEGKRTGGDLPFGFQINPEDPVARKLIPQPAEARFLRSCAEHIWAGEDNTVGSMVRWANSSEGMKPRRAEAWSRTTLIQCLTRLPEATEVDIFTPDERALNRKVLETKPGTGPLHKGGSTTRRGKGRRPGKRIASSGLLACSGCQSTMTVHPRKRTTGVKVDDYRCGRSVQQPGSCPRGVAVFAEFMDDYLEARFLNEYGDAPEYTRRATVTGLAAVEEAELAVSEALRALEKAATPEAFAALQAAQLQRQDAEAQPQTAEVLVVPTGRTIRQAWEAAEMPEKQAMLRQVWSKIIVGPGKQGQRSLDLNRLTFVGRPPYVAGVHETISFVPGGVVVEVDAEDEAAARDRLLA